MGTSQILYSANPNVWDKNHEIPNIKYFTQIYLKCKSESVRGKKLSGCCLRETDGFLHFFQEEEFLAKKQRSNLSLFWRWKFNCLERERTLVTGRPLGHNDFLLIVPKRLLLLDAWSLSVWQHHCLPRLWESQEDTESLNWIGFSVTKSHSTGEGRGWSSSTNVTFHGRLPVRNWHQTEEAFSVYTCA